MHEVDLERVAEGVDDRRRLALPQHAVIHEHAGELIADRLVNEDGDDRRVDPAGQRAQHPVVADLGANLLHGRVDERGHRPRAVDPAHFEEVLQDLLALRGVRDLGMELDGVEAASLVSHGRHRAVRRRAERLKPPGRLHHGVAVAHPHAEPAVALGLDAREQRARPRERDLRRPVLAPLRRHHVAAQQHPHRLHPVADAEHGDAGLEQLARGERGALFVDAGGTAGEDDALVAATQHRRDGLGAGDDLGIDGHVAHAAGDQLRVLPAEINYGDFLGWGA